MRKRLQRNSRRSPNKRYRKRWRLVIARRLVASRGLFRHWQETNASPAAALAEPPALASRLETGASRALPEGSVWTFNVAPDSVYGQGCNFSFATFGILNLGTNFADWRITVQTVEIPTR